MNITDSFVIIDSKSFEIETPEFSTIKEVVAYANENLIYSWFDHSQIAIVRELKQFGLWK
jgi:hypothetical protein